VLKKGSIRPSSLSLMGECPVRADLDTPAAEDALLLIHPESPVIVEREHFLRAYADAGATINTPALIERDDVLEHPDRCTEIGQALFYKCTGLIRNIDQRLALR